MLKIISLLIFLSPLKVSAASYTLKSYIDKITNLVNVIVPILITLAIVLFFYHSGIGIFGTSKDSAAAKSKLKETLLWGVGIIFVMVSIWGILNLIGSEFDLIKPKFGS